MVCHEGICGDSDSISQTSRLYNRNGKHGGEQVNTRSNKNVPDSFSKLSEERYYVINAEYIRTHLFACSAIQNSGINAPGINAVDYGIRIFCGILTGYFGVAADMRFI
jgi:hypothetical protein